MTRRDLIQVAALWASTPDAPAPSPLEIPLHRVTDKHARSTPEQRRNFFADVWHPAIRCFARGGITFRISDSEGEVLKHPSGRPSFRALQRGVINVVLTDRIPVDWDMGRSPGGASAIYEGFCVCVLSFEEAHGNQIPFLSVNTFVHELLHILLQDVFTSPTGTVNGVTHEGLVDLYATRLWLFGEGEALRHSARLALTRLPRS